MSMLEVPISEAWERAYKDVVNDPASQKAAYLLGTIGPRITSAALGLADARQLKRWAAENVEPARARGSAASRRRVLGRPSSGSGVPARGRRSILTIGQSAARRRGAAGRTGTRGGRAVDRAGARCGEGVPRGLMAELDDHAGAPYPGAGTLPRASRTRLASDASG